MVFHAEFLKGLDGEDFEEEFRLTIHRRLTENLEMEKSSRRRSTSSNVVFKHLRKMGYKGKGLGKDEQGQCS